MRDDSGDLLRRGLWFAAGGAALWGFLILRMQSSFVYPAWIGWGSLFLAVPVALGAVETERDDVNLVLSFVSLGASVLGLLIYCSSWFVGHSRDGMLDFGPMFTMIGFGTSVILTGAQLWDVLGDLLQSLKPNADKSEPSTVDDPIPTGPTKNCPHCGQTIAAYAAACRHCKCIL